MPDTPRWPPLRLWRDLDSAIEQTFAQLIHEPWGQASGEWMPVVDLFETPTEYLLAMEIPGVPPESVTLQVQGALLTIRGERQSTRITQAARAVRLERSQGRFSRTIRLERPVNPDRLETHVEQGVFYARLPKRAPGSPGPTAPPTFPAHPPDAETP